MECRVAHDLVKVIFIVQLDGRMPEPPAPTMTTSNWRLGSLDVTVMMGLKWMSKGQLLPGRHDLAKAYWRHSTCIAHPLQERSQTRANACRKRRRPTGLM